MRTYRIQGNMNEHKEVRDAICCAGAILFGMPDSPEKEKLKEYLSKIDKVHQPIWDSVSKQQHENFKNMKGMLTSHINEIKPPAGMKWCIGVVEFGEGFFETENRLRAEMGDIVKNHGYMFIATEDSSEALALKHILEKEFELIGLTEPLDTDATNIVYIYYK